MTVTPRAIGLNIRAGAALVPTPTRASYMLNKLAR